METHYETQFSNNPTRGLDGLIKTRSKVEAIKIAKEKAKIYSYVEVEKVYMSDEYTYEQFVVIGKWDNGKG